MRRIHQIVDRCHASDRPLDVVRSVIRRLGHGSWLAIPRADRRSILGEIIARHCDNRELSYNATRRWYSDV